MDMFEQLLVCLFFSGAKCKWNNQLPENKLKELPANETLLQEESFCEKKKQKKKPADFFNILTFAYAMKHCKIVCLLANWVIV